MSIDKLIIKLPAAAVGYHGPAADTYGGYLPGVQRVG
jgi:hypothetical protein